MIACHLWQCSQSLMLQGLVGENCNWIYFFPFWGLRSAWFLTPERWCICKFLVWSCFVWFTCFAGTNSMLLKDGMRWRRIFWETNLSAGKDCQGSDAMPACLAEHEWSHPDLCLSVLFLAGKFNTSVLSYTDDKRGLKVTMKSKSEGKHLMNKVPWMSSHSAYLASGDDNLFVSSTWRMSSFGDLFVFSYSQFLFSEDDYCSYKFSARVGFNLNGGWWCI